MRNVSHLWTSNRSDADETGTDQREQGETQDEGGHKLDQQGRPIPRGTRKLGGCGRNPEKH